MFERELGKDRRKNVARQKADITYEVVWNSEGRTFDVYRNGRKTEAFAKDQGHAIELATDLARHDHDLGSDALVFSVRDGGKSIEWVGTKPHST